ncbi:hypothetical protein [Aeromonas sp. HMWF015]|uniref:hypothetical protein n=1 Tax=Aeromonas sp. HMWF015 TaxID=2056851 RepID=UPI000D3A98F9|nr:hypothetical protein [Aeromonas sp. HMWF015]PTT54219.1 hypothetical protein DBR13_10860 [Aeromonas sp. HMWF015]
MKLKKLSDKKLKQLATEKFMKPVIDSLRYMGYRAHNIKRGKTDGVYTSDTEFGILTVILGNTGDIERDIGTAAFTLVEKDFQMMIALAHNGKFEYLCPPDYRQHLVEEIINSLHRYYEPSKEACQRDNISLTDLHNMAWMFGTEHQVDADRAIAVKVDGHITVGVMAKDNWYLIMPVIEGEDEDKDEGYRIFKYEDMIARAVEDIKSKCRERYAEALAKQVSELIE